MIDYIILTVIVLSLIGAIGGMMMDGPIWFVVVCFFLCLSSLIGALLYSSVQEQKEHDRLIAQCMEDGKKEYECEAMLKSPETRVMPMPIVIPIR